MIAHRGKFSGPQSVNSLSKGCGRSNACSIHLRHPTLLVGQPFGCCVRRTKSLSSSGSVSRSSKSIHFLCSSSLHNIQPATATSAIPSFTFPKHRVLPYVTRAQELGEDGRVAFHVQKRSVCMSAGKRSLASSPQNSSNSSSSSSGNAACMRQLGFTDKQVARILSHYTRSNLQFNTGNLLLWLQLLVKHHVKLPMDVVSANPMILESRAENVSANAEAMSQWLSHNGISSTMIGKVFSKRPMLLSIPYTTFQATIAWLISELGWSTDMIVSAVNRTPQAFCFSVANLELKKAWFLETGFGLKSTSKMFLKFPGLMNHATERNEKQFSALQACGLSTQQALELVKKQPQLIALDISGANQQAKVQFLTRVMGKQITEVMACPAFFTYSLFNRIGPRWAFHCIHAEGRIFKLSTGLTCNDEDFLGRRDSASNLAECKARGVTILQLYHEFIVEWQQGEGKQWNLRKLKSVVQTTEEP